LKKLTYEEVKQYFELYDYTLISTEYINSSKKLLTFCPCGHKYEVSYNKFSQGKRCTICQGIKRYTYEEVKDIFKDNGCELLSTEYINNHIPLKYKCSCGNYSEIRLYNFLIGERCKLCGMQKTKDKQKHSYDYVKDRYENKKYILLSDKYNNYHEPLECICPNGHHIEKSLASLDFGYDCYICADQNLRLDYTYLKSYYASCGCELLTTEEEYCGVGHNNSLEFRCSCGNITQNSFYNFKNGERCWECAKNKKVQTNLIKYGVEHTLSDNEVWLKTRKTLYKNGNVPSSTQQDYLYKIFGGELNYLVENINVDILLDNLIIIEYDGSGHDLSVKYCSITQEQFNKKEIRRSYFLKNKGYKIIRIISTKDKLPLDDTLLLMLDYAKEYLSTNHSWIHFDIDNQKIITSQYIINVDYGKLRKIKSKDIEDYKQYVSL
jgi:hypothetical protein